MSACCCSLAGTAACQTCSQNPFAVMSKLMTPQPTALRDIMVNPQIEKPMTNADRIRAMSNEELADYFSELSCWPNAGREDCRGVANCMECWLDWLKSAVEVDE